jgi:probable rRNA maturation factor
MKHMIVTRRRRAAINEPHRIELALQYAAPRAGLPARSSVAKWLAAALTGTATVTVRFVGRDEGRRLNRAYRERNYATNVLTFAYGKTNGRPLAGDIVLCAPVVASEAHTQRKSLRAHYAHLIVHGALHLRGYDHERPRDATRMEKLEGRMLLRLGYADPYARRRQP